MLTGDNKFKVTKFAPNARFKMHMNKPVIVMLDEIGKPLDAVILLQVSDGVATDPQTLAWWRARLDSAQQLL